MPESMMATPTPAPSNPNSRGTVPVNRGDAGAVGQLAQRVVGDLDDVRVDQAQMAKLPATEVLQVAVVVVLAAGRLDHDDRPRLGGATLIRAFIQLLIELRVIGRLSPFVLRRPLSVEVRVRVVVIRVVPL